MLSEYELFKNSYCLFHFCCTKKNINNKLIFFFSAAPLVVEEMSTSNRPHYIFDTKPLIEYITQYIKDNWQKFVILTTTTAYTTTVK